MKKQILTVALALILGTATGMAQEKKGNNEGRKGNRVEQMVSELGLDEKQAAQFKAIMDENKPMKQNGEERPSREEMEKKRSEMDAKVKAILTEEQYKKYQEMRKQRGNGRRGK